MKITSILPRKPTPLDTADAKLVSITGEIAHVEETLAGLEASIGDLALKAVSGEPGSEANYDKASNAIATAKLLLKKLTIAKAAAQRLVDDEIAKRQHAESAAHRERVSKLMDKSLDAFGECAQHLDPAIAAYFKALDYAGKAVAAWPGGIPPMGAGLSQHENVEAVQAEIARLGHRPFLGGRPGQHSIPSFPGGAIPAMEKMQGAGNPSSILPLVDRIKQAHAHARAVLNDPLRPKITEPVGSYHPAKPDPLANLEGFDRESLVRPSEPTRSAAEIMAGMKPKQVPSEESVKW
jgi:hypothetical protein